MTVSLRTPLLLCALALATALAGCTTTGTRPGKPQTVRIDPAIAQAYPLAAQHAGLTGQARSENAQAIQRLLAGLDDATLATEAARIPEGDALYNFAGRELLRRGLEPPRPLDREGDWRFDAGDRPAADRDGYRPPRRMAVLLPLTGDMAVAASPVRDGLLTAYYSEHRAKPELHFYDTGSTPAGTQAAYQKAVAEGADFVLGPLGRDQVSALFAAPLQVPVLALNRGTTDATPPNGSASFALAPEDDGIAAAEYLLARKARRVLVLVGSEDSLRRSASALGRHLDERGGSVVRTLAIGDKPDVPALQQALQTLAQDPEGVDAVFMAVKGAQARVLTPLLALTGFSGKPQVATPQLLSGTGKPEDDKALDGIAFPTEAWGVRSVSSLPPAQSTGELLPTARGPAAKLYAFGHDAWMLSAYLERLARRADATLPGATGTLRVDGYGNVLREPVWSTFSDGRIVALRDTAR